MIPNKLTIDNFISHSHSVLDFSTFDTAIIIGTNRDNPDISNGAGKTTIFDAICWALYGKSRFNTKDKVIKRNNVECKVDLEFSIGEDTYRIVRKLNKISNIFDVTFYKKINDSWSTDGLTCETNTVTNKKIVEIIGISYEVFINSVYFKQNDIFGFANAPSTKRKEILKEMLQMNIWDECLKISKDEEKKLEIRAGQLGEKMLLLRNLDEEKSNNIKKKEAKQIEIADTNSLLVKIENDISKIDIELNKLEKSIDNGINKPKLELLLKEVNNKIDLINDRRNKIKLLAKANINNITELDSNNIVLNVKLGELASKALAVKNEAEIRKSLEDLFKKHSKDLIIPDAKFSYDSLSTNKMYFDKYIRDYDILELEYNQLVSLEPGSNCPICLSSIDDSISKRRHNKKCELESNMKEANKLIISLKATISEEEAALKAYENSLLEIEKVQLAIEKNNILIENINNKNISLKEEFSKLTEECKLLDEERVNITSMLEKHSDYSNIEILIKNLAAKKADLIKEKENNTNSLMKLSIDLGNIMGHAEEIERKFSEKNVILTEMYEVEFDIEAYEKLTKIFGKDGVQSIIFENITEDLRTYTNLILKDLSNELMVVDFTTQRQNISGKWREDFDIKILIDGDTIDFDDLSGGEQTRLAFALRLALSRLLMSRVGSNIKFLLLDEVDQSLDKYGLEVLAQCIHSLSSEFKTLIITHNELMKEYFENVIFVKKSKDGSVIVQ